MSCGGLWDLAVGTRLYCMDEIWKANSILSVMSVSHYQSPGLDDLDRAQTVNGLIAAGKRLLASWGMGIKE